MVINDGCLSGIYDGLELRAMTFDWGWSVLLVGHPYVLLLTTSLGVEVANEFRHVLAVGVSNLVNQAILWVRVTFDLGGYGKLAAEVDGVVDSGASVMSLPILILLGRRAIAHEQQFGCWRRCISCRLWYLRSFHDAVRDALSLFLNDFVECAADVCWGGRAFGI